MSALNAGDMVQLVFACCAPGRGMIGWTGTVEGICSFPSGALCANCGFLAHGLLARVSGHGQQGVAPVSWFIKVEPPAATETTQTEIEVAA